MEGLLLLGVLALAGWWYNAARAREQAVLVAKRACGRHGLVLLDETVLLERVRPRRGHGGRVGLRREYSFEFSDEGERRDHGLLVLFEGRVLMVQLSLPDGELFDTQ